MSQRIRIVAANLTSTGQRYAADGPGARILKGLKPDVVLLQEANVAPGRQTTDADFDAWVADTFGPEYRAYREPGDAIPNAIISRFPFVETGEWPATQTNDRDYAWARIDVPGEKNLLAVSVHLRTKASVRRVEAEELVDHIREAGLDDYLVVGGDFNTDKRTESVLKTLDQVVDTGGPYPLDSQGDPNTNANRDKPYDGVYVTEDLEAREVPVTLGEHEYPHGLVLDTRENPDLDQLEPTRPEDSAAPEMQHMAVARDFEVG